MQMLIYNQEELNQTLLIVTSSISRKFGVLKVDGKVCGLQIEVIFMSPK